MSIYRRCFDSTWRSDAPLLIAAAGLLVAVAGCGGLQPAGWLQEDELYVQALPDEERTRVGKPPVAALRDGETALTIDLLGPVVDELNGLTLQTLAVLQSIVAEPPTERQSDRRTWGPDHTADFDVTYRLEVLRAGERFDYELFVAPGESSTATTAVLRGDHTRGADGASSGAFGLDGAVVDAMIAEVRVSGEVAVQYAIGPEGLDIGMDLTGLDVTGLGGLIAPDLYTFHEDDEGGALCFYAETDLTGGSSDEQFAVYARWGADGGGRSDGTLGGGDVGSTLEFTECWDSSGEAVVWWDSAGLFEPHGDVGDCPDDGIAAPTPCNDVFPG